MPQFSKTSSGNNPDRKAPGSKAIARDWKGRRTGFIIASVVIVLILVIVGVSLYINSAPFRRTVITVDDTSINMDYFLKRIRLASADPMDMIMWLTNEQFIKIEAPRYVAEVSLEDIDQELRRMASGESETISENEFKEWYRQILNETDLSDSEYKEIVATGLLTGRFNAYLAARVPTVAEQIHLHSVVLNTEDMEKIWEKDDAGEDVDEFISEIWQDKQSEGTVEDLGWLPRGILVSSWFDEVAFSLTVGDVSEIVPYVADAEAEEIFYYLLMVSEKAEAREIDEDPLQILKDQVLEVWLLAEREFHEIGWYGLKNGFDDYTYKWIQLELAKK